MGARRDGRGALRCEVRVSRELSREDLKYDDEEQGCGTAEEDGEFKLGDRALPPLRASCRSQCGSHHCMARAVVMRWPLARVRVVETDPSLPGPRL